MLHEIAKPVYKERVVTKDRYFHIEELSEEGVYIKPFNSFNINGTVITFYTDSISPGNRKEMMLC